MTYIDEYQQHFICPHVIVQKKQINKKHKKNKLSQDFDKLFFHFLVIIKYDIPMIYNKHEEQIIKYSIAQKMENYKYKHKDALITHLCYEDCIDLRVLSLLASFFKVNLLFYHGNIMIKMIYNMDGYHLS